MPLSVLLLAAGCLAVGSESRPLEIHAPRFTAHLRQGSVDWLEDREGTVYVRPGGETTSLAIDRISSTHFATKDDEPAVLQSEVAALRHYGGFTGLVGATAEVTCRLGASGELILTQEALSPEKAVWGVSWSIGRIPLDYAIVVPGRSGIRLTAGSPGRTHQFDYPMGWEASLVVVEGPQGGLFVCGEDGGGRFKRLVVERNADGWQLTFTTINFAPFDALTAVKSVPWHLDVYQGDWRVPARRYRRWMEDHFRPVPLEEQRPRWVKDVGALVIMGLEREMLPLLAQKLDPAQTMLYVPSWRKAGYDRDYPAYDQPLEGLMPFLREAHARGFRVMLHVNYFGVDPLNPLYNQFEPFQVRSAFGQHEKLWWVWDHATPEIRFAYINPALKAWREYFVQAMVALCRQYPIDALHLDQTLCIYNDHNGLIDGMSMLDGNLALHRELREALPEIALSGEGLNEVTFCYEAFAQRHAWGVNHAEGTWDRKQLATAHPISSYLFRPYTILNGYLGCAPPTSDQLYAAWNEAYEHWGVIPTLKPDAEQLRCPTGFSRQFFDEAAFWLGNRLRPDIDGSWPPAVAFPFRTADGRFSVKTTNGRFQYAHHQISRTVTGVGQVEGAGTIPGWHAFDEKRLIGLDPDRWYPYFHDQPRDQEAFHVTSLPEDIVCDGVMAREELAVIRTRRQSARVVDLSERLDQATCGSQPFQGSARQWKGPGMAEDGGGFTQAGDGILAAHPPWKTPQAGIAYARFQVDLPAGEDLVFTSDVALAQGASGPGRSDGVTFRVSATDGKTRLERELHHASQDRQILEMDLGPLAGTSAMVELAVSPGPNRSPSFDWARWCQPRIERRGTRETTVSWVGGPHYSVAVDARGLRAVQPHGRSQQALAQLPGSLFLLRAAPASIRLPVDLIRQPRTVVFLNESGRELFNAEHAGIQPGDFLVGGEKRAGLQAHPPDHGRTIAHIPLKLPAKAAHMSCRIGLRDGSRSDGVSFAVEVNGQELIRQRVVPGGWQPISVDLSSWAGQPVVISLVTDADGSFNFDWACWGEPVLAAE